MPVPKTGALPLGDTPIVKGRNNAPLPVSQVGIAVMAVKNEISVKN